MKDGMKFNQRDIVLMPFPYSDLTTFRKRPALIISNEIVNRTQDRICCLITTSENLDSILIEKTDFELGELPFRSFVKPHRIFSVNENIIIKKLCNVTIEFHEKIIDRVNEYFRKI